MSFLKKKPKHKQKITAKPKTNTVLPKPAPKPLPKPKPPAPPLQEPKHIPPLDPKPDIPKKPVKHKPEVKQSNARSEFLKVFKQLTYRHRAWDIWRDFVVMFACTLSNAVDKSHYDEREKRYLKIICQYSKQEQGLFPELLAHTVMALEEDPEQDFLGSIFMELNLGNDSNGQFFTPYDVCVFMAKVTMNDNVAYEVSRKGFITVNDPCFGAGATLIAGIHEARRQLEKENLNYQNHILVIAQDIDEIAALMCYIQLSLLGVAAYIKVGNTLTDPIADGDDTDNYWYTLMYFSDVWVTRRRIQELKTLMKGDPDEEKVDTAVKRK